MKSRLLYICITFLLLLAGLFAQAAVKIAPDARFQYMDGNGDPCSGCKLYTYVAGSTTNQSTFTDSTGASANTNPIILNSNGYTPNGVWLTTGVNYKFVLHTAADVEVWSEDNINGVNDATISVSEWEPSGLTPTFVNTTQFTLTGDQTDEFHVNRRLQLIDSGGTDYGSITASAFTSLTTVTVALDGGGVLDSGLSSVSFSINSADNVSVPDLYKVRAENSSSGTNTVTLAVPALINNYVQGLEVTFKAGGTNTGATTININSLGAKTIKHRDGSAMVAGDITTGRMYTIAYDGTDFILTSGGEILVSQLQESITPRVLVGDSGAISSAATVDFDDVFTSTYDVYEIELIRVKPATDSTELLIRTGASGSTYDSGASDYSYSLIRLNAGTNTVAGSSSASNTHILTSFSSVGNATNEEGVSGTIKVFAPTASTYTQMLVDVLYKRAADGHVEVCRGVGERESAASAASIRFLMASGNITSGRIRVYGLTNGSL